MSIERARELRKRMPAPEAKLWNALREIRPLGFHFRRQVQLGPYYADFAIHAQRLVIEIEGDTHGSQATIAYDTRRDALIACQGYRVLRFTNEDIMRHLDGVMTVILGALETPTLTPSPQGGGKPARRLLDDEGQSK
ncbi:very-short-patch-repair endonuclease [Devosia sp. UYZn731]|uniref:endonuclease domain-containing protein n=1 Tax=Devosia sp. UYZn731 TaxID=3156345 RepID=UPI00339ACF97